MAYTCAISYQQVEADLFADQDKAVILEMHSACGNAVFKYVSCISSRENTGQSIVCSICRRALLPLFLTRHNARMQEVQRLQSRKAKQEMLCCISNCMISTLYGTVGAATGIAQGLLRGTFKPLPVGRSISNGPHKSDLQTRFVTV